MELISLLSTVMFVAKTIALQCTDAGAYAGGVQGVQVNPPFFQINYIHSMAWHACLACK